MEVEDVLAKLTKAFIELEGEEVAVLTSQALEQNIFPLTILNTLTSALGQIGNLFENGQMFLPELVIAGEMMKHIMPVLEAEIKKKGEKVSSLGQIVIGTVYGDLHDIGKNLVMILLQIAGFTVYDLGVNVPPEKFVSAARDYSAQLIAMSALLTTTMREQKKVIDLLKEKGIRDKVKVMIGGAAITSDYAREIGADGYSPTAPGGVKLARALLGC